MDKMRGRRLVSQTLSDLAGLAFLIAVLTHVGLVVGCSGKREKVSLRAISFREIQTPPRLPGAAGGWSPHRLPESSPEGFRLLQVELALENKGSKPIFQEPWHWDWVMTGRTSAGEYDYVGSSPFYGWDAGPIPPGFRIKVPVVFVVARSAEHLTLSVSKDSRRPVGIDLPQLGEVREVRFPCENGRTDYYVAPGERFTWFGNTEMAIEGFERTPAGVYVEMKVSNPTGYAIKMSRNIGERSYDWEAALFSDDGAFYCCPWPSLPFMPDEEYSVPPDGTAVVKHRLTFELPGNVEGHTLVLRSYDMEGSSKKVGDRWIAIEVVGVK